MTTNTEMKWWKVSVYLDGRHYADFLTYAETEEDARDEIADNEPQGFNGTYNQMDLTAEEYEGAEGLDVGAYHLCE